MELYYQSTRGGEAGVTASQAVLKGLADDGGLFMPARIPGLDRTMEELADLTYQETAYEVMKLYLTDYTEKELKSCIARAYDSKFDTEEIAPFSKADGAYYLELYHGSTIAFKDMALSILPHLMVTAAKKNRVQNKIVVLTATSGDTGKAAMAGFAEVPGTEIIVFYPKDGVSRIQELQMVTQKGDNTHVIAVEDNFDAAQTGVKEIFGDKSFAGKLAENGCQLSSANSINIGRLVPQVVYYVYAYGKLLNSGEIKSKEPINVTVPTGNFGNILAAYLAKQMGVPIKTLICASNENKVLYDFFRTGTYDRNRKFLLTSSPSMDILISSNLERLIYLSTGCDAEANRALMEELSEKGSYTVTGKMRDFMKDFWGGYASEEENRDAVKRIFDRNGYLIDPHTGVAAAVYDGYRKRTKDTAGTVIVSTASPYKFPCSVLEALDEPKALEDEFAAVDLLKNVSGVDIPRAVEDIRTAPVRHTAVCETAGMKEEVAKILSLNG